MGILRQDTECETRDLEKYQLDPRAQKQVLETVKNATQAKPYLLEYCVFVLLGASVSVGGILIF